jgi:lipoprotein-anchoring transpeptidase ErfK/SrfK
VATAVRSPRLIAAGALATAAAALLSGCGVGSLGLAGSDVAPESRATLTVTSMQGEKPATPGEPIVVTVADGRFTSVVVKNPNGRTVKGTLSRDGRTWTSQLRSLGYGATYTVDATAVDREGVPSTTSERFSTLVPSATAGASISPRDGAVMGVGMPLYVRFDQDIADRAAVEKRLEVTTSGPTPIVGAWSWTSDREVSYRPRTYWPANTTIAVTARLTGVELAPGVWGDKDRTHTIRTGDAMVSTVNMRTHVLTVTRNGKAIRSIPITTGKQGFETRSGVKVIIGKERTRLMDASTGGTSQGDPEYYRLTVEYAMRLTWSGEFLHAAPWSVGAQGSANVSHGCTGMSTANAAWLYANSRPGDVVVYTGNNKALERDNGITAWNVPWQKWIDGSALGARPTAVAVTA